MATSSSFFTLRRGSTKSLTFQVYRGKQVTKDRVQSVANPQTNLQMLQRIKLAGIMQTRSTLKPILNHAFEGVEYGEKSLEEFIRLNLQNKNNAVNFVSYGTSKTPGTSVASYQISKGSLVPLKYNIITGAVNVTHVENSKYPSAIPETKDAIVNGIYSALGAEDDDQISFIYAIVSGQSFSLNVNGTTKTLPILKWRVARIRKNDSSIMDAWSFEAGESGEAGDYWISDGQTGLRLIVDVNDVTMSPFYDGKPQSRDIYMAAVVLSRPNGDDWRRSTQYLATWSSAEETLTAEEAIWLLTTGASSSLYLNAGGSGSIEMTPITTE